ncbi:predicted protein [Thalassiosira pseudonana CCMP1335]|uniref:C3H1-type domain-containing protein n=1 Tax=Thalassiosira pseudonana TaxID=35128 RepID=B8BT68_THAPS|nr:predicted protein [Thalassiosira pseudonana CCMP1335]EED96250.1 predicted protein [Thalassiosira pseudonana CCMP1335]
METVTTPYPQRSGEPDCRDYLRTGRCKYGESCKYNHPPNVESGGGVKPLNPGEPMFPIRPTEPPCQYFLKHGTCKFGQSCKFNHPAGGVVDSHVAVGGEGCGGTANGLPAGLVFLTTTNNSTPSYTVDSNGVFRQSGSDAHVSSLMAAASSSVQVLPQRPTEPNCIYFLRNGRCKYGATCKFHHPIDTAKQQQQQMQQQHSQNAQSSAVRRDRSNSFGSHRLQPITEQQARPQQATHVMLPSGQIAVIIDPQSLHQVNGQDRPKFYLSKADGSIGTLQSMDQNTAVNSPILTATTASSSFQTLESNAEAGIPWGNALSSQGQGAGSQFRGQQLQVNTAPSSRNGSGGSLSAYGSVDSGPSPYQQQQGEAQYASGQYVTQHHQQQYSQSQNQKPRSIEIREVGDQYYQPLARTPSEPEVNDSQRYDEYRYRAASLGSTAEHSTSNYWPSNGSMSVSSQVVYDRDVQCRQFDPRHNPNSFVASGQTVGRSQSFDRHATPHQRQDSSGNDDGLTMMTSALLTMMDRPEDDTSTNQIKASSGSPSREYQPNRGYYSQSEPNILRNSSVSSPSRPNRPPPGMMLSNPPRAPYSNEPQSPRLTQDYPRPSQEGSYIVGGYDQTSAPRF